MEKWTAHLPGFSAEVVLSIPKQRCYGTRKGYQQAGPQVVSPQRLPPEACESIGDDCDAGNYHQCRVYNQNC